MASVAKKCSICQKLLDKERKPQVTLPCWHTFHRECAKQRLTNAKSGNCPVCRKKSALEFAFTEEKSDFSKRSDSHYSDPSRHSDKFGSGSSTPKSKPHSSSGYEKDSSKDKCKCPSCSKQNSTSSDRCISCKQSKYAPSSAVKPAAASVGQKPAPYDNSGHYDSSRANAGKKGNDYDNSSVQRQRWNKEESNPEWSCDECEYVNRGSDATCKNCRQGKQSASASVNRQFNRSPSPVSRLPSKLYSSVQRQRWNKEESNPEWACDECEYVNRGSDATCRNCRRGKQSTSASVNRQFNRSPSPVSRLPSKSYSSVQRQRWNKEESNPEWSCDECEYVNRGSDATCKNCRQGKQSASASVN